MYSYTTASHIIDFSFLPLSEVHVQFSHAPRTVSLPLSGSAVRCLVMRSVGGLFFSCPLFPPLFSCLSFVFLLVLWFVLLVSLSFCSNVWVRIRVDLAYLGPRSCARRGGTARGRGGRARLPDAAHGNDVRLWPALNFLSVCFALYVSGSPPH